MKTGGPGVARWMARIACAMSAAVSPQHVNAQVRVPLVLHHLVVEVDTATWNEIAGSSFLADQFSATESGDLEPPDPGKGIRLIGKYNYVQLTPRAVPGGVAIVIATERAGDLAALRAQGDFSPGRLGSSRSHAESRGVHLFELSERIRPSGSDSLPAPVELEFMQYTDDAGRRRALVDSLPETQLTTARFLAQWYDPRKLFSHLTGATLAMPVDDIGRIVAVLKRDGIPTFAEGEGAVIKLDGFTLHLIPPWTGAGVRQLQFALTRDVPANPVYRFGPRSRLRFGPGPIAVWDFTTR